MARVNAVQLSVSAVHAGVSAAHAGVSAVRTVSPGSRMEYILKLTQAP